MLLARQMVIDNWVNALKALHPDNCECPGTVLHEVGRKYNSANLIAMYARIPMSELEAAL